jgi:hypothetical protein
MAPHLLNPNTAPILQKNQFCFDSSKDLSTSKREYFNNREGVPFTSQYSKILYVEWKVSSPARWISHLRVLKFFAPEARGNLGDEAVEFGVQVATYHLCAMVRLMQGMKEMVRVYGEENGEFVQMDLGIWWEGDPPSAQREVEWTVKHNGSYMLFYHRVAE